MYIIGCIIFSFGAYLFIISNTGTDPVDVFSLGFIKHIPASIGEAQLVLSLFCVIFALLLEVRVPPILSVLTFFLCGSIIDILLLLHNGKLAYPLYFYVVFCASFICTIGSALIIISGYGIRPVDFLSLTISRKFNLHIGVSKALVESTILFCGWILGGPVGYGTIVFVFIINISLKPIISLFCKILGTRNYGIPNEKIGIPAES